MASYLDNYKVLSKLGSGATAKVKAIELLDNGGTCAAKILKPSSEITQQRFREVMATEIACLRSLNHPNIVNHIHSSENGLYVKKNNGGSYNCMYLLLELCSNGELFDMLFHTGKFSETTARFYLHQIILALGACHDAGIAHRDLKPENILFNSDFDLKITDFGFSIFYENSQPRTRLGTEGYMAPEIQRGGAYDGPSVDVFSAGVILFIMYSQNPPFGKAVPNDPFYRMFLNDPNRFWALHSRQKPADYYSDDFKNLLQGMLTDDPGQRLTIQQIKEHPWYKEPITDVGSIKEDVTERREKILESARRARDNRGSGDIGYNNGQFFRGDASESQGLNLSFSAPPEGFLAERTSGSILQKGARIITGLDPSEIMKIVSHVLNECRAEIDTVTRSKVSVSYVSPTSKVVFGLKCYVIEEEDLYVLDFTPEKGSPYEMIGIFNSIKEGISQVQEF